MKRGGGGLGKGETESRNTLTRFLIACLAGNKVVVLTLFRLGFLVPLRLGTINKKVKIMGLP